MSVARYWRLTGITTYGGGSLEFREVAFYEGASRIDGSATITSTATPTSGSLANLKDLDTSTGVAFAGADVFKPGFAITWDLGTSYDIGDVQIAGVSRATFPSRMTFERSSDGVVWTDARPCWNIDFAGAGTLKTFVPANDFRWQDTMILMHGDGTDGSPTIVDHAAQGTLSAGASTISTAVAGLGGSAQILCTTAQGVVITATPDKFFDSVNGFTLEGFVTPTNIGSTSKSFFGLSTPSATNAFSLSVFASGELIAIWHANGSGTGITLTNGTRYFIQVERRGTSSRVFVNGTLAYSNDVVPTFQDSTIAASSSASFFLNASEAGGDRLSGRFEEVRLTRRGLRYNFAAGATPTVAFQNAGTHTPYAAMRLEASVVAGAANVAGYVPPGVLTANLAASALSVDTFYGGTVAVVGDVKKLGVPSHLPLRRRVRLYHKRDRRFIRETWSDAATGTFTFTGLKSGDEFHAIAYDHLGHYRAVAVDKIFGA